MFVIMSVLDNLTRYLCLWQMGVVTLYFGSTNMHIRFGRCAATTNVCCFDVTMAKPTVGTCQASLSRTQLNSRLTMRLKDVSTVT